MTLDPALCRGCRTRPFRLALPPGASEMAALRSGLWKPGTTIGILFGAPPGAPASHRGTIAQRAEVWTAATILMQHANVKFVVRQTLTGDLTASPTIRCAFDPGGGSWSYVGREFLSVPRAEPTMNIGWPNDLARSIHELCHALGYEHGHQSYAIPWNPEACYAFYGAPPNSWSRAEVDQQVLSRLNPATLIETAYDPASIMDYPRPAFLLKDPNFAHGANQTLSPLDLVSFQRDYPF